MNGSLTKFIHGTGIIGKQVMNSKGIHYLLFLLCMHIVWIRAVYSFIQPPRSPRRFDCMFNIMFGFISKKGSLEHMHPTPAIL